MKAIGKQILGVVLSVLGFAGAGFVVGLVARVFYLGVRTGWRIL